MAADRALRAAKEWLDDAICECGHLDVEHSQHILRHCSECECCHWRPVRFHIQRAAALPAPQQRAEKWARGNPHTKHHLTRTLN